MHSWRNGMGARACGREMCDNSRVLENFNESSSGVWCDMTLYCRPFPFSSENAANRLAACVDKAARHCAHACRVYRRMHSHVVKMLVTNWHGYNNNSGQRACRHKWKCDFRTGVFIVQLVCALIGKVCAILLKLMKLAFCVGEVWVGEGAVLNVILNYWWVLGANTSKFAPNKLESSLYGNAIRSKFTLRCLRCLGTEIAYSEPYR